MKVKQLKFYIPTVHIYHIERQLEYKILIALLSFNVVYYILFQYFFDLLQPTYSINIFNALLSFILASHHPAFKIQPKHCI